MLANFIHSFANLLYNVPGWRTNRKIIVIESDDWGSIRMPSRVVYENALKEGYRVDLNEYEKYDSLLSENDINKLYDVLGSFRDFKGNHPIITANCVVCNPDFKKIEDSEFSEYFFETITNTFQRYPNHKNVFSLWENGLEKGLLKFQYHAREHLNVSLFMSELQRGNPDLIWGFNNRMPGMIGKGGLNRKSNRFVESTRFQNHDDMIKKMEIYFNGLSLFETLFGYKSLSVIPTNYLWNDEYNKDLLDFGVIAVQGSRRLINPLNPKKSKIRFIDKDKELVSLVRNVTFELSLSNKREVEIERSLDGIKSAFRMKKPAIISMHRINFAGEIFEENREINLNLMFDWIEKIIKMWPDVEFISSDELAKQILYNDSNTQ
jgi:hypothetical protein